MGEMEACRNGATEKLAIERPDTNPSKQREPTSSSDGSNIVELASCWPKFRMQMNLLRSALNAWSPGAELDLQLKNLLFDCLSLYSVSSENFTLKDVGALIPGGRSVSLEPVFEWLGGWRPSSALMLVYSVLGYDSQGKCLISAARQTQAPELSDKQLSSISNLQKHTQQAEHELSYQFAMFQMLLADQTMVKALVPEAASSRIGSSEAQNTVDSQIQKLIELSKQAEKLRFQTLQELFNLLTPVQAARCSIAAFELAFAMKNLSTDSLSSHRRPQTTAAYI